MRNHGAPAAPRRLASAGRAGGALSPPQAAAKELLDLLVAEADGLLDLLEDARLDGLRVPADVLRPGPLRHLPDLLLDLRGGLLDRLLHARGERLRQALPGLPDRLDLRARLYGDLGEARLGLVQGLRRRAGAVEAACGLLEGLVHGLERVRHLGLGGALV